MFNFRKLYSKVTVKSNNNDFANRQSSREMASDRKEMRKGKGEF